MLLRDVGDSATSDNPGFYPIAIERAQSDSVVLTNVAGSTLSYYSNGIIQAATGTLTAAQTVTLTAPAWFTTAGRTSIKLTGGQYGT